MPDRRICRWSALRDGSAGLWYGRTLFIWIQWYFWSAPRQKQRMLYKIISFVIFCLFVPHKQHFRHSSFITNFFICFFFIAPWAVRESWAEDKKPFLGMSFQRFETFTKPTRCLKDYFDCTAKLLTWTHILNKNEPYPYHAYSLLWNVLLSWKNDARLNRSKWPWYPPCVPNFNTASENCFLILRTRRKTLGFL